jgi:hypothetical protein
VALFDVLDEAGVRGLLKHARIAGSISAALRERAQTN